MLECFRAFAKRRLEQGRLPDSETHVPEFVDDSVVRCCGSCGRVHYKGKPRIWWRSKQDERYEVGTREATHRSSYVLLHARRQSSDDVAEDFRYNKHMLNMCLMY
jgi:hypothetical protein